MKIKDFDIQKSDEIRRRFSVDASIFEVVPQGVFSPEDTDSLGKLVRAVVMDARAGKHVAISPRSGGTCMSGGSLTEGIVVDMTKGFDWVDEVDIKDNTVWSGGGTWFREVWAKAAEKDLLFPSYPNSKEICGVGGMIGNNASGELSVRYGATCDNVEAVRAILADGREYEFGPLTRAQLKKKCAQQNYEGHIYRGISKLIEENWDLIWKKRPKVRKNAAGYALYRVWDRDKTVFNLAQLFIGAQGTLGIVTAVKLKLVPIPKFNRMLVVEIDSLARLAEALKIITSHHPAGVEMYDKHTYELAKQYLSDMAADARSAEGKEMILFAWFSEHSKDATDHAEAVCQKALRKSLYKVHTVKTAVEQAAHIEIRRQSFQLLKDYAKGKSRAVPFIEDIVVNVEHYGEFVAALEAILSDYQMVYTYAGHIGDGSIRLIPLVDMEAENAVDQVFELAQRVYDLVFAFGGSMSVDHNDGIIRTPFVERMFGEELVAVFAEAKHIFDPLNIFNTGKKVAGTLEFAKAHMSRSNTNPLL